MKLFACHFLRRGLTGPEMYLLAQIRDGAGYGKENKTVTKIGQNNSVAHQAPVLGKYILFTLVK